MSSKFYKELAQSCAKNRVAMDVVVLTDPSVPQAFLDLATLSDVCRTTNGRLIWISAEKRQEIFRQELLRQLVIHSGWDAVFKVRCSTGLQVKHFYPSNAGVIKDGGLTESPELELSVVTPDTCIAVNLEHRVGGLPKEAKLVFIQTALLYTCPLSGQRRVRVSTLALRTSAIVPDVYRSMDFGAIAALELRLAATPLLSPEHDEAGDSARIKSRYSALERCVNILASYRSHTPSGTNSSPGQLLLPDKFQLLPLFCSSLMKSPILRPSLPKRGSGVSSAVPAPRADERAYYLFHALLASPVYALLLVHPNLFSVIGLADGAGEWQRPLQSRPDESSLSQLQHLPFVQMPPTMNPSVSNLKDDEVMLLDCCFSIFVIIGRDVPKSVAENIETSLEVSKDAWDHAVGRMIGQMRAFSHVGLSESFLRPTYSHVVVVDQSRISSDSPRMQAVLNWMVCDATTHDSDFVDFLCDIHRQVRLKYEGGR